MIQASPTPAEQLDERLARYRQRGVSRVKLGLTDVDGVLRGKYVSLEKFAGLMRHGGGFCDCVFGWDVDDVLYDHPGYTGWHTGFPDARYRLLTATERWLEAENCPFFLGEFVATEPGPVSEQTGEHPLCPRTLLRRLLEQLARQGLRLKAGFEYEFFVFRETPQSVRDKGYRELLPLTPGNFGYSVLRTGAEAEGFTGLLDECLALDCPLEGLHCETGPGVWEAALAPADGLNAADRAALFKTFSKIFCQRRGWMATFMAKWSMAYPGQSGHFHFSLLDGDGGNLFHDPEGPAGMSRLQRQVVGGVVELLPELLALLAPTINSYTRLVRGAWAPTAATWGVENRTAALRVIGDGSGSGAAQRLECRVPGADANPYLVAAAMAVAALEGVARDLSPPPAVLGNAYEVEEDLPEARRFAGNLRDAADRLAGSAAARRWLGDAFVDHFVMSRRWECREYERQLNSWQLERYFEII